MMQKYYHNVATGEIAVKELTPEEIEIREKEYAAELKELAEKKLQESNLRELKISAYKKLGLTDLEINALLPVVVED